MRSLKAHLWPWKGQSLAQSDGRVPLDGETTRGARGPESLPSIHGYNAPVSTPAPRDSGWTPLGVTEHDKDSVHLQEIGRSRVDPGMQISQPENASTYYRM